jgi:flagellin-like protein
LKFSNRRAVSPIIASLLLIAIAVAAGIIVYVYVNSLAGNLTGSGGSQVSNLVQMQSYDFSGRGVAGNPQSIVISLKNSGGSSVTISSVYFDGTVLSQYGINGTTGYYNSVATHACETGATNCQVSVASASWYSVPITNQISINGGYTTFTLTDSASNPGLISTSLGATADSQLVLTLSAAQTPGTTHTIKIITSTGGQSVISVVAGGHG